MRSREAAFLLSNRVARLATVDEEGGPHLIPICYAYDGEFLYSAVDEKPKRVKPDRLKRIRNIAANPKVALLVDAYDEDWSKLAFVLIQGKATLLENPEERERAIELLRKRYEQYIGMDLHDPRRPIIKITLVKVTAWGDV